MTTASLCVTVTGSTTEALRAARDAVSDADIVEIRLDGADRPDVRGVLAGRRHPVIVTCRPRWEGGAFDGSEEERHRLLVDAVEAGAEYIDVEWRAGFDDLIRARDGRGTVLSYHDFDETPPGLADRVREMRRTGAEVIKVAVQPQRLGDVATLLDVAAAVGPDDRRVLIAMGWPGLVTRVLPSRFGSCWAYAGSLEAVGQVTAQCLVEEFRFREVGPSTVVYGLAGSHTGHSVLPAMHNAAYRALGIDAVYVPFEAADADDFLDLATRLGVKGAGVSAGFEGAFSTRATRLDETAERLGAANTVRLTPDGLEGANFAVDGFLEIGGLDMLVAQAERQCEWWFGRMPPAGVMRAAAERCLARRSLAGHRRGV